MLATKPQKQNELELHLTILGRTLEHFGVQMYKQRPAAVAELVANCWDAGSPNCTITLPDARTWSTPAAEIVVADRGCGMSGDEVQEAYLVLGRNRREDDAGGGVEIGGRRIMGRKGIGKLAGFGIADEMEVETWKDGAGTRFKLLLAELTAPDDDVHDVPIVGERFVPKPRAAKSGTRVILRQLRNKTPLDPDNLRKSLARRFGRVVKGAMNITVNDKELPDPLVDFTVQKRTPRNFPEELATAELPSGKVVRYGYAFTKETIKNSEMQGFTVLVHQKTAQAPPFFFRVESTASGQHATRYVSGVIEADYLDDATDTKSDVISTDRQEIDWNHTACQELLNWGQELARKVLTECTEYRGKKKAEELEIDPAIKSRIEQLDRESKKQVHKLIGAISYTDADEGRTTELVDSLLKVFEFRHFHDMVEDIEKVADNPAILAERLDLVREWKVLESRAVFEVIQGRLAIIQMFERALADDAPETAHRVGQSNLHDAIGRFPWLLNPDYHIFTEEKSIATLLYEWAKRDKVDVDAERIDFAAISDDRRLIIVEIKRTSRAVDFEEVQRLERYAEKLTRQTKKEVRQILIYGGSLNISKVKKKELRKTGRIELRPWGTLFDATKKRYERYKAILDAEIHHKDFKAAEGEVAQVREVIQSGSFYRTPVQRRRGLGNQQR
jgi:hypothetical protein